MRFMTRRPNPVYSDEYKAIVRTLIRMRGAAGLTQRTFAQRLGRSPSHIHRIESGQRRVDTLELYYMAQCLSMKPTVLFSEIAASIAEAQATIRPEATDRIEPGRHQEITVGA